MRQMPIQKEKTTKLRSLLPPGFGAKSSKGEPDQDDMKKKKSKGLFGRAPFGK